MFIDAMVKKESVRAGVGHCQVWQYLGRVSSGSVTMNCVQQFSHRLVKPVPELRMVLGGPDTSCRCWPH